MELKVCSGCKKEKYIHAFQAVEWKKLGAKRCGECKNAASAKAKWWTGK